MNPLSNINNIFKFETIRLLGGPHIFQNSSADFLDYSRLIHIVIGISLSSWSVCLLSDLLSHWNFLLKAWIYQVPERGSSSNLLSTFPGWFYNYANQNDYVTFCLSMFIWLMNNLSSCDFSLETWISQVAVVRCYLNLLNRIHGLF